MADLSTVTFSGSSAETIEQAKAFWKSIDPPPKPKSSLVVSGIDHRLQTAPKVQNGNKLKSSNQAGRDLFEEENDPRLEKHLEDAQKRKEQEQADYIQRMTLFREEAQQRLAQREAERLKCVSSDGWFIIADETLRKAVLEFNSVAFEPYIKKEEISHNQCRDPVYDASESSDEDEEIAEAMAEIDKFEETLKQKEASKLE